LQRALVLSVQVIFNLCMQRYGYHSYWILDNAKYVNSTFYISQCHNKNLAQSALFFVVKNNFTSFWEDIFESTLSTTTS